MSTVREEGMYVIVLVSMLLFPDLLHISIRDLCLTLNFILKMLFCIILQY